MKPFDEAEISRRRFLALAAASAALGSGVGCRRRSDRREIAAYTRKPEEIVPGVATYYASAAQEGEHAYGVLVKTREGRPIHIEGNVEDPVHRGKTGHRILADLLGLYDPDRLKQPCSNGRDRSWGDAVAELASRLREASSTGRDILLLMPAAISPTRRSLVEMLSARLPRLSAVEWEPWVDFGERRAARAVFGASVIPRPHFDRASVILALGSDFLGTSGDAPRAAHAFVAGRAEARPMSRLYALESTLSLTGASADQRWSVRPSALAPIALALANALSARGRPLPAGVTIPDLDAGELTLVADDLHRAGNRALVVAGPAAPEEAHRAAYLLNRMLGAEGVTTDFVPARELVSAAELAVLVERMAKGAFGAVLFWGVNPAYDYPDHAAFARALGSVPVRARIGRLFDETAELSTLVLPENHWLESWGDFDTIGHGSLLLAQPVTPPLYDTLQGEDVLLRLLLALGGSAPGAYADLLRQRWEREVAPANAPAGFERFWNVCLHDGVYRRDAPTRPALDAAFAFEPRAETTGALELVLRADSRVLDGRHGNNGWLQELPDPVDKTSWGNPLSVSSADAARLGLSDGDVVELTVGAVRAEAPVLVEPAQASGTLGLALGYGRRTGTVAAGVGVNAWPLLGAGLVHGVRSLVRTGRSAPLTRSQTAFDPQWRDIARVFTVDELAEKSRGSHADQPLASLYADEPTTAAGPKWGMTIDLAACIGCGACVVACQSENNVPVVGPEQVQRGRAMHWIRIDRYAHGNPTSPRIVHEPMLCQHCGHAPCENVCPVQATNHSPDGLNQMVYNRCVGTRYCGNNCPYKVRRFNFLDFTGEPRHPLELAYNPEVTVRPRGVMEKCTFCVQRIRDAEQTAKDEGRPLRDGEVKPACAAACPTDAIVFGDLRDPSSAVARAGKSERAFRVLEELGVRPSITYLAALRNPGGAGAGR